MLKIKIKFPYKMSAIISVIFVVISELMTKRYW